MAEMMTARRDVLSGTPEEIASMLEQLSRGMANHEYLAGTQLRTLAVTLARNPDLLVWVVTYGNESQELEVALTGFSGRDPIIIDRNSAGTGCQVALNKWLTIGTEPEIENTADLVTALLHVWADHQ
jgi:hypothetical protein